MEYPSLFSFHSWGPGSLDVIFGVDGEKCGLDGGKPNTGLPMWPGPVWDPATQLWLHLTEDRAPNWEWVVCNRCGDTGASSYSTRSLLLRPEPMSVNLRLSALCAQAMGGSGWKWATWGVDDEWILSSGPGACYLFPKTGPIPAHLPQVPFSPHPNEHSFLAWLALTLAPNIAELR